MPTKHIVDLPELVHLVVQNHEDLERELRVFIWNDEGRMSLVATDDDIVRFMRAYDKIAVAVDPYEFSDDSSTLPDSFHIYVADGIELWATRFIEGAKLFKLVLHVETDSDVLDIDLGLEFESEAA